MRFLCIGGSGFVGTYFQYFVDKNQLGTIINIDNGRLSTNKYEYIDFDIKEKSLEDLINTVDFKNIDIIINFAAITRVEESILNPWKSFEVNVNIHHKICEALRILKKQSGVAPTCLFFSTGGAIAGETTNIIDENILPKPISVYGASKLSCEALGYSYSKSFDLDIRNLRFTNIYGPFSDLKESVIARFIKLIQSNQPIEIRNNGTMSRDFLYVEDVCTAIINMILHGYSGLTIQFGNGVSYTIEEVLKYMKTFSPNIDIFYSESLQGEVSSVDCNISMAKKLLNWTPEFTIQEGLEYTWNYFKNGTFEAEEKRYATG